MRFFIVHVCAGKRGGRQEHNAVVVAARQLAAAVCGYAFAYFVMICFRLCADLFFFLFSKSLKPKDMEMLVTEGGSFLEKTPADISTLGGLMKALIFLRGREVGGGCEGSG